MFHFTTKKTHIYQNTFFKKLNKPYSIFAPSMFTNRPTQGEKELTMPNMDTAQCHAKYCKTAAIQCLHLPGDQSAQQ